MPAPSVDSGDSYKGIRFHDTRTFVLESSNCQPTKKLSRGSVCVAARHKKLRYVIARLARRLNEEGGPSGNNDIVSDREGRRGILDPLPR